jgi:hypothetical protein
LMFDRADEPFTKPKSVAKSGCHSKAASRYVLRWR